MSDPKNTISFDELSRIAVAATEQVRSDAERAGTLLPVWKNDRVVYEAPQGGTGKRHEDDLKKLLAELRTAPALKANG